MISAFMKRRVTKDVILKGPVWSETVSKLKGTFFETAWDIYALSISIGLMYDKQIPTENMIPENYIGSEAINIPRTVLTNPQNISLLDFMFQTILITTKTIELGEEERLELAFSDSKELDFDPFKILTGFANYGVTKIYEAISDTSEIETMEQLTTFLEETYKAGINLDNTEDLLEEE